MTYDTISEGRVRKGFGLNARYPGRERGTVYVIMVSLSGMPVVLCRCLVVAI